MPKQYISFRDTNYFSSLICDYLDGHSQLKSFYKRAPKLEHFKNQIEEKKKSFSIETRTTLATRLAKQYASIRASKKALQNIEALKNNNTFTITTGHQLNLLTGPLYFFYKIISAINLCKVLKEEYPEYHFVPIYWMASEDHDFEEINFFNLNRKKIAWNQNAKGAVGRLKTKGLEQVLKVISSEIGQSDNAKDLKLLFEQAYLKHNNLADATRYLVNTLFLDYGLVILNGDDTHLKQLFVPYIKEDLIHQKTFKAVTRTNTLITKASSNYKIQVNPRAINLFYLKDTLRERIVMQDNIYSVVRTNIKWSKTTLLKEVEEHPERFSPNVILRPLYQEVILPNLCYIGGGGELAYWLQLKQSFDHAKVRFPILLLRSSLLLMTSKQNKKINKLGISLKDLFLKPYDLQTTVTKTISKIKIDLSQQKKHLEQQFKDLYQIAKQTDASFLGAVAAQERKQIKGLEHLEQRLLKAQKRRYKDMLDRIILLQNELFPNQSLQERYLNFSQLYLEYGTNFIPLLIKNIEPLKTEFLILEP